MCMCVRELSFNELHTLLIISYKLPKYYSLKHAFLSPLNPPTNTIKYFIKTTSVTDKFRALLLVKFKKCKDFESNKKVYFALIHVFNIFIINIYKIYNFYSCQ